MEDGVNLPLRGNAKMESCAGDAFFYFEGTCLFHLKFLRSIHVKVGDFEPDFVSYFPRGEFGGYLLPHLLLGYFVGGLSIVMSGR